jgi:hypothetical protein
MARRQPVASRRLSVKPINRLSAADIADKLKDAGVPHRQWNECAHKILQFFEGYDLRVARRTEASQAESLRIVADAARELAKALAALPPALRLKVEPDYTRYLRKGFAEYIVEGILYSAAASELASADPDAQWFADQNSSLPEARRRHVERSRDDLLLRAKSPLQLEIVLAAMIATAEKAHADMEKRVSRASSIRRNTRNRNDLALTLKAIIRDSAPALRTNEQAAEDWVAELLDAAGIRVPSRQTNAKQFRAMFARGP